MPRKERVTKVIDGDTFQTNRRVHSVRLASVDTPEKNQRGFSAAKTALESLIRGKEVTIDTVARDKYGRAVADVKVGRTSVNRQMKKHEK